MAQPMLRSQSAATPRTPRLYQRGGVPLASVTGGSLTVSNTLERVRVIRDDGKIEAAQRQLRRALAR
jgi:hypothetical protein